MEISFYMLCLDFLPRTLATMLNNQAFSKAIHRVLIIFLASCCVDHNPDFSVLRGELLQTGMYLQGKILTPEYVHHQYKLSAKWSLFQPKQVFLVESTTLLMLNVKINVLFSFSLPIFLSECLYRNYRLDKIFINFIIIKCAFHSLSTVQ